MTTDKRQLLPLILAMSGLSLLFAAQAAFRGHEEVVFGIGVRVLGMILLGMGGLCTATALGLAIRLRNKE